MSVGALNSVAFDQSATWSNSLTASNGFISGTVMVLPKHLTDLQQVTIVALIVVAHLHFLQT